MKENQNINILQLIFKHKKKFYLKFSLSPHCHIGWADRPEPKEEKLFSPAYLKWKKYFIGSNHALMCLVYSLLE